jgi:hypothetical protein
MAGEGLASIRQWPHPAGADCVVAFIAIDEAGAVAAMRALETRPVEFAGFIRILRRLAAGQANAGIDLSGGTVVLVDPGDLEAMGRA